MIEIRRNHRFECDAKLTVKQGKRTSEATVIDISRGGLRLETSARLSVGQQVSVLPKESSQRKKPIKAVVRWVLQGQTREVGLEFQTPQSKLSRRWIRKLFPDEGGGWRLGTQKRTEVRAPVSLPMANAHFEEGTLLDISANGARFELAQPLSGSESLYLCLPWSLLKVEAKILRAESRPTGWEHSVQFRDLDDSDRQALQAYVESAVFS